MTQNTLPGILARNPLFASLLLMVYLRRAEWLVTALEWTPLRYLGRISYGLYFYHWPVLLLVLAILGRIMSRHIFHPSHELARPLFALLTVAITVGISSISYQFIEKPCLNLKRRVAP
jgi:peptidoglycan/LPS O-acetylase OafA/YrhL